MLGEAVARYFVWLERRRKEPKNRVEIDEVVAQWVERCWAEGEPRGYAADTLSGLQHFVPALKGHLQTGWKPFLSLVVFNL